MKTLNTKFSLAIGLVFLMVFSIAEDSLAQRFAGRGGGRASRPAMSRPTTSRPTQARPSTRPAQARPSSRPAQSRPTTSQARPTTRPTNRESVNGGSNRVTRPSRPESKVGSFKGNNSGNRTNNINTGDRGSNNRVNVDKSRGDVNVNINNSRNTVVRNNRNVAYRPPYRPYPRPPYMWGGFGFYWYRPYYYHPFVPFYWGPVWHPWGFFVATLAVTAIVVSVDNQDYHYDEGVFYVKETDGYVVVEAPQGANVTVIPKESEVVEVSPTVNNYYYGGTFYEQKDGTYTVVPPPAGSVVSALPEGAEEVKVGDQTFVKYGDTYYMPVEVDGKNMYEIVQVEEDK
ncbi:hypothetical protein DFQ04_1506 [Algoriphagus boseongensis]|uniref:Uncharacterized protein n=1 Tax=Algoriphagus boseongensis TaxID=1442587 RepID=A0A4R6TC83_9BACT|nr:DUF6515 family protein [Algoriphagus boseongensis]TDQ19682.1 hypothetical protein DFQ04_1506 [Algoriphagus boseongensis]